MVHGTVLSLKPAEKYTAKWLLRSLQGFPKCALQPPPFTAATVLTQNMSSTMALIISLLYWTLLHPTVIEYNLLKVRSAPVARVRESV